jgi:hypothetical protein
MHGPLIALWFALTLCAGGCRDSHPTPKATSTPSSTSETPADRQFAAWLTAFNAGDRDKLVAYHQQSFPYEVASDDVHGIDREFGLSQGTGGFELKKPEHPTPTSIVAILKERHSEQFARAAMEVDAAEPHRVTRRVQRGGSRCTRRVSRAALPLRGGERRRA